MLIIVVFLLQALFVRYAPKKYYRAICLITTVVLSYLAFNVTVTETVDLYRHHLRIDLYRTEGWGYTAIAGQTYRNPLTSVFFFLCSFLDNNNWYQAISIFIIYSCIFSLIWKIAEDKGYNCVWLCKATLFVTLCFNYYQAVYAIRIWIVFAVLALCFYVDCVRNTHKIPCMIVYVLCIFFHYASLLLIGARILVYFFMNTKKTRGSLVRKCFMAAVLLVAAFLFLKSSYADIIFEKTSGYENYTTRGIWQTLNCWVRMLAVSAMSILYYVKSEKDSRGKQYSAIVVLMLLIAVLQLSNYQITLRFADAMIAFSPLFIAPRLKRGIYSISDLCMFGAALINCAYIILFDYRFLSFTFM